MAKKIIIMLFILYFSYGVTYGSELMTIEALNHYNEGAEAQAKNDLKKAKMAYQIAILIDREGKYKKFVFNNTAIMYLNANDIKRAEYYFNEALKVDPDYEVAKSNLCLLYLKLAMTYKKQNKNQKALNSLSKAYRYFSKDSFILEGKKTEEDQY